MIPFDLNQLADLTALSPDTIIDVRSPSEFAEDHLPGAINLPVLDDAERAHVGTLYKQDSPFAARKTGGALVARNTAGHLQTALVDKPGAWRPLVYCWRGGQRSGAFATILDQIGWRVHLLKGGYQSYRKQVVRLLYDTPLLNRIALIEGGTGTAKTAMLEQLGRAGAQVIDLERLAGHRGSLFGGLKTPQPSQKMFETRLASALGQLDPERVTFLEAESSKIGERLVPPQLWTAMTLGERVHLDAPLTARAQYLARAYADLTEDQAHLENLIRQLKPYHSTAQLELWQNQAQAGDWANLAASLMAEHYDPRYTKSAERRSAPVLSLSLPDLEEATLARTAAEIVQTVR